MARNGKTCKFAFTKKKPLPKKEELEEDMYLVLPLNNEKLLEALQEGFGVSSAARAAFMDLEDFRADPLRFFLDRSGITLSDEEKLIVARGFVTKKELQGAVWPHLTGYKMRMDAQRDRVLASPDFIKTHVTSKKFAEDADALKDRVTAEMAWLFDAAEAFEKAQDAAAAQRAAAKAAKASDKASPKKPGRKRKTTVPKKTRAPTRQSKRRNVDAPPTATAYQIGDRVEAHWYGGEAWFPGTIDECNTDGTYAVLFDDNGYDDPVLPHHVRRAP